MTVTADSINALYIGIVGEVGQMTYMGQFFYLVELYWHGSKTLHGSGGWRYGGI